MKISSQFKGQSENSMTLGRRKLFLASASSGLLIGLGHFSPSKSKLKSELVELNHYVQVYPNGNISIIVPGAEIGQGIFNTLPMIVAEEMDADWENVSIRHAITNPIYGNPAKEGRQTIGNSDSIIGYYEPLRKIGAAARYMLIEAAAKTLNVSKDQLSVSKSFINHEKRNKSLSFGELATLASSVEVPENPKLKDRAEFKLLGKYHLRKDTPCKVDGSAIFGADVKLDGKLFAALRVSNVYGAILKGDNRESILKMPGIVAITQVDNGLAVIGKSFWQAKKASDSLEVEWDFVGRNTFNSSEISKDLHKALDGPARPFFGKVGDAQAIIDQSDDVFEAVYEVPYLAHACMEPMVSTALVTDTECKMWSPHQQQTAARKVAADITGLDIKNVHLENTFAGGGFGRKWELDFAIQSVQAALAVKGHPVTLIWTREQDIQNDYYRSAYVARVKGAFDKNGDLSAMHGRLAGQSILGFQGRPKKFPDPTSISGLITRAYKIPNKLTDYAEYKCFVPVGFWRGVSLTQNGFFSESAIDEFAHYSKRDPYKFRRSMLDLDTREIKVLDAVAEMSGWGRSLPDGRGLGIAICPGYGSVNAQVIEVEVSNDQLKIIKVWCAYDCGFALDPSNVIHQMEGGIVYGLSATLFGEITFDKGAVVQSNFHDYDSVRLSNMPEIEVNLIESDSIIGGVGESAVSPVAPALANAIFSATGKRLRSLPLRLPNIELL